MKALEDEARKTLADAAHAKRQVESARKALHSRLKKT